MIDPSPTFEPIVRPPAAAPAARPPAEVTPLNRMLPGTRTLRHFLQLVIEVLDGRRSLRQLLARLAPAVADQLDSQARRVPDDQARTLAGHAFGQPHRDKLEFWGTARTRRGRVHALAGRVEVHGLSWRCTAFGLL